MDVTEIELQSQKLTDKNTDISIKPNQVLKVYHISFDSMLSGIIIPENDNMCDLLKNSNFTKQLSEHFRLILHDFLSRR